MANQGSASTIPVASAVVMVDPDDMDYKDQGRNMSYFYPTPTPTSPSLSSPANPPSQTCAHVPVQKPPGNHHQVYHVAVPHGSNTSANNNTQTTSGYPSSSKHEISTTTDHMAHQNKVLKRWLMIVIGILLLIVIVVVTVVTTLTVSGGNDDTSTLVDENLNGVATTTKPTPAPTVSATKEPPVSSSISAETLSPTIFEDPMDGAASTVSPTDRRTPSPTEAPTPIYSLLRTQSPTISPTTKKITCDDPITINISCETEVEEIANSNLVRNWIRIDNYQDIPDEYFVASPHLPPCGLNDNSSRTWVRIFDASDDSYIYGYCGFSYMLPRVWFAAPAGEATSVKVVLIDRECNKEHHSNVITSPCP